MNEYLESLGHTIRLVNVDELKKGDVIIFNRTVGETLCAKVITPPNVSKTRKNWYTKQPAYTAVKCSVNVEEVSHTRPGWNKQPYTWIIRTFKASPPSEHTMEKRFDLNYKTMILIDREDEL
jgi:hypothetical protein